MEEKKSWGDVIGDYLNKYPNIATSSATDVDVKEKALPDLITDDKDELDFFDTLKFGKNSTFTEDEKAAIRSIDYAQRLAESDTEQIIKDRLYQEAVAAVAAEIDYHSYEYTWCVMCGYAEPDFQEMKYCPRCGIRNSYDRDGTLECYAYLNNSDMPICLRCSHPGIGHRFVQPTVQRCVNKDFRCDCDHYEPSNERRETHADGLSNLLAGYPIHVDELPGWHLGLELVNSLNVAQSGITAVKEPPGWKPHWRIKPV